MSVEKIVCGVPITVTQSTAYALPPHVVGIHATAAVDISPDNSTWNAITAATTGTTIASAFIRCTAATNCVLVVQRYN